jgi:uncharacterized repeat protein (TIGR03803 family)
VGGLIPDQKGNLWGVTQWGGTYSSGTVFELYPSGKEWAFRSIYDFQGGNDGIAPSGHLVIDRAGDLFGMTVLGGSGLCKQESGCGTIFRLTGSGHQWAESVVHAFTGGSDGAMPEDASLAADGPGTLYGTTSYGGKYHGLSGFGVVFKLVQSNGGWTETVLHTFPGSFYDGFIPFGGVTLDNRRHLYGLTTSGGQSVAGTAYEIIQ